MKISKLLLRITSAALLCCLLSIGASAYFGDVNQYNNLPGQYEQNPNTDPFPSLEPRAASQEMTGEQTLNTAIAVIVSILGASALLAIVLGVIVRVRNDRD